MTIKGDNLRDIVMRYGLRTIRQSVEEGLWCKPQINDTMIEMNLWDGAIILETELDLFKWKHFEAEIILLTVRWYLKYSLSYHNLV